MTELLGLGGMEPEAELPCHFEENAYDLRVTNLPGRGTEIREGRLRRPRGPVRAMVDEGVEDVGHEKNAGADRNQLARQAVRVPSTVEPLVMVPNHRHDLRGHVELLQEVGPERCVRP